MKNDRKNWLEQIVTVTSIILVMGTFAILIFQMVTQVQTPPDIIVKLGSFQKNSSQWKIPIEAKNEGSQTAKDIYIEVSNNNGPGNEKVKIHFDYIPGKSSVKGVVILMSRPVKDSLKVHVSGYEIP